MVFKCLCAHEKQVFFTLAIQNQVCFMGPDDLVEKNVLPTVSIGSNFKYIINNNKTQRMPHRVFHDFLLISRFILLRCRYYIIPRVRLTPKFFILFNFFFTNILGYLYTWYERSVHYYPRDYPRC